jgi:HemY protein
MRRIIAILVTGAVTLAVAWFLAGLPGQVVAEIGSITIELSTPVAALGLLLVFTLAYVTLRLLGGLIRLPRTLRHWQESRHRQFGDVAVTKALLALAAGEKADARREAARARRFLGDTPQTLLLAAEAGRLAERDDETEAAFRLLADRKDAAFLGYRGLLRQAIARGEWAEATTLARRAEAAHPGAQWLRQERAQLAIRAEHWAEALELADQNGPRAALAAGAAAAEPNTERAMRYAREAWRADPGLPHAALAYAERLRAGGHERRAQTVIARAWAISPQPDLAAFALASVQDKLARTQAAQRLTAETTDRPESRLLLARTSLDAGLTGEARHHAEAARASGLNERRLWLLLADIEEEERGDTEAGRLAQRDALRRSATADPDPTWQCGTCHARHATWLPACPVCWTGGSVRWTTVGGSVPIARRLTVAG